MGEMVDLVSFGDMVMGQIDKEIAHKTGALHRAVHLWIVTEEAGKAKLLLQKRGDKKQLLPSLLDVSAAGHLQAGEAPLEGMLRECREELGFCPKPEELVYLGRRVELFEDQNVKNFEICYVYVLRQQRPLCEYRLAYPEVSGLYLAETDKLMALLEEKQDAVTINGLRAYGEGAHQHAEITITRESFVPRVDAYMQKLLLLLPRFLAGESSLYI